MRLNLFLRLLFLFSFFMVNSSCSKEKEKEKEKVEESVVQDNANLSAPPGGDNHQVNSVADHLKGKDIKKDPNEISWEELQSFDLKTNKPSKELEASLNRAVHVVIGFIIPVEYEGDKVKDLLLVPFVPNCMHVPPPLENQMVLLKLKKAITIETLWLPFKATGKIKLAKKTGKPEDIPTTFEMVGDSLVVIE